MAILPMAKKVDITLNTRHIMVTSFRARKAMLADKITVAYDKLVTMRGEKHDK